MSAFFPENIQTMVDIDLIMSPVLKLNQLSDIVYTALETKSEENPLQQKEFFKRLADSLIGKVAH